MLTTCKTPEDYKAECSHPLKEESRKWWVSDNIFTVLIGDDLHMKF